MRPVRRRGAQRHPVRPRRLRHEGRHRRLRRRRRTASGRRPAARLDQPADHRRRGRPRRRRHRAGAGVDAGQRPDPRLLHRRRADLPGDARRHGEDRPPRQPECEDHGARHAGPRRLPAARRQPGAPADPHRRCADRGAAGRRQRLVPAVQPAVHQHRRRQPGDQRHPRIGARDAEHPLQQRPHRRGAVGLAACGDRAARRAVRPRHRDQRRVVPDRARPAGGHAAPGDRRGDAASSRSSTPAAAPRTRASSRATARWRSSAWSAPPCTRRTNACRWRNCATSRGSIAVSWRPSWHERPVAAAPQARQHCGRHPAPGARSRRRPAPVRRHARGVPGQPRAAARISPGGRRADAAGRRRPLRAVGSAGDAVRAAGAAGAVVRGGAAVGPGGGVAALRHRLQLVPVGHPGGRQPAAVGPRHPGRSGSAARSRAPAWCSGWSPMACGCTGSWRGMASGCRAARGGDGARGQPVHRGPCAGAARAGARPRRRRTGDK